MRLPQGSMYKHECYKEGKNKCVSSIAETTAAAEKITVKSHFMFNPAPHEKIMIARKGKILSL